MTSIATTVECGGERHRVVWSNGEFQLPDHADPDGERTLAALGGTPCACVEAFDAWARHSDDPALLTALTRGTAELLDRPSLQGGGFFGHARPIRSSLPTARIGSTSPRVATARLRLVGGEPADERDDFDVLYALGPALGARLVAAVTETCLRRVAAGDPATLPALRASLVGRAGLALTFWTEGIQPVHVETADPEQPPSLRSDGEELTAVLHLDWVANVWGRGLATLANRFVIDVADDDSGELLLFSVGPDLGPIETIAVGIAR